MKIVIHDYAGHPFPTSLSRELARRGHSVWHLYFGQDPGPKGELALKSGDPEGLVFEAIDIARAYKKGSMITRRFNDVSYGKQVAFRIADIRPDVVISGNTPTEAQEPLVKVCERVGSAFIYWVQDFYSVAAKSLLTKKLGAFGVLVGSYYQMLERKHLRKSGAVVAITEDFVPLAADWAGDAKKVEVVENWGAIGDISVLGKDNDWAKAHDHADDFVFVYSGTLGLKHNPEMIAALAERMKGRARVLVVGQGLSVPKLLELKSSKALDNLEVMGVQPFADLPQILATGDVLVAVVEKEAGVFSVPSKVQSYMCAGRPVLLAAPTENLVSRIVLRENAGLVSEPDDTETFLAHAERLFSERGLTEELGRNGRAYAERNYDVKLVTDRFEKIFANAVASVQSAPAAVHAPAQAS